jgi:hypothetical protein
MMKNTIIGRGSAAFLLYFFVIASCSKSSSSNNNCSFGTDPGTAASGSQVSYTATGTGSTSLSSVSYQGVTGLVIISKPTLPWSITVPLPNGGTVGLNAIGTASNGGIITLVWSISTYGNSQSDTAACGH